MSPTEMMNLYKAIKQSEKSANDEKVYHETISAADKHELDLSELMLDNRCLRSNSRTVDTSNKMKDNNEHNDSFFPTHGNNNSDFSSSDSEIEVKNQCTVDKIEVINKTVSQKSEVIKCYNNSTKNINVFVDQSPKKYFEHLVRPYKNEDLPFHCRPDILCMPEYLAVAAIMKYHDLMALEYKKMQMRSLNKISWSKGIPVPLCSKGKNSVKSGIQSSEIQQPVEQEETVTHDHCLRSRRNIKRKSYTEFFTDDENFQTKKIRELSGKLCFCVNIENLC